MSIEEDFKVEARPVKEGKDPLAEGNTLVNPTNTEDDGVYELLESSEDVRKAEKTLRSTVIKPEAGYQAPQVVVPKIRNVHNKSEKDLAEVVKTSKRAGR
jgi:hypothetical protein